MSKKQKKNTPLQCQSIEVVYEPHVEKEWIHGLASMVEQSFLQQLEGRRKPS